MCPGLFFPMGTTSRCRLFLILFFNRCEQPQICVGGICAFLIKKIAYRLTFVLELVKNIKCLFFLVILGKNIVVF